VIKNEGARPIKLLTGLCVVQGQTYGFSVQPDRVTLELAQGTQTEIPFTLQAHPTVRPHQYWLCGYILAHGGVQMVSRSFWVTVKGGH
jgi:hypothetical protein